MAIGFIPEPSLDLKRIHFVEARLTEIRKGIKAALDRIDAVKDLQALPNLDVDLSWEISTLLAHGRMLQTQQDVYERVRTLLPEVCSACRGSQRFGSGMGAGPCMVCNGNGLYCKKVRKRRNSRA